MAITKGFPVKLFWAPYGEPCQTFFLGNISSSFLLSKRRRLVSGSGCHFAIDVNPRKPPGVGPTRTSKGPDENASGSSPVFPNRTRGCKNESRNGRVARAAVRVLSLDQTMERTKALPPRILCGQLRSTIRSVFSCELTPVQELSIKTAQKLEKECVDCRGAELDAMLSKWKEARFQDVTVDHRHLARFKRAVRMIIPDGWNRRKYPYIPNGHATMEHSRCEGGTWNREEFSEECAASVVFSSGKPRIVTLYSSENSRILSPLHDALYGALRRKGWLLVGSPTDAEVQGLNGKGDYVSIDYSAATDNIKAEYVRSVIEVLKEKGFELSDEETRAMDVLGNLRIRGSDGVATRGQPMGSLMSFPMLCLINKATVDLALADLLESGEISREEFRLHRCLINGDDLLFREIKRGSRRIYQRILLNGAHVGLVVNVEKTMVDASWAEINSTAFYNGSRRKKTNVSVVEWKRDVTDPIGFLFESVRKLGTFKMLLPRWERPIAEAERKVNIPMPRAWYRALGLVRDAILSVPSRPPTKPNLFPVVPKPARYCLSRQEEISCITERVARLQDEGRKNQVAEKHIPELSRSPLRLGAVISMKKPRPEEKILQVLAEAWETKEWSSLTKEHEDIGGFAYVDRVCQIDKSLYGTLVDVIQSFKRERRVRRGPDAGGRDASAVPCGWIPFD